MDVEVILRCFFLFASFSSPFLRRAASSNAPGLALCPSRRTSLPFFFLLPPPFSFPYKSEEGIGFLFFLFFRLGVIRGGQAIRVSRPFPPFRPFFPALHGWKRRAWGVFFPVARSALFEALCLFFCLGNKAYFLLMETFFPPFCPPPKQSSSRVFGKCSETPPFFAQS